MSELRQGRIRDPVHGYIPFTAAEALLLGDPLVQRLHYVRQSAASQFVFPSMNVSRFEHSVGAMHLAGRLFRETISHAPDAIRHEVLSGLDALIGDDLADYGDEDTEKEVKRRLLRLETALRRQGSVGLQHPLARVRVNSMVVEQALRFASLLHDLGHLPFSHDFEYVLGQYFRSELKARQTWPSLASVAAGDKTPVHEMVGHRLAAWLSHGMGREITASLGEDFQLCVRVASRVTEQILLALDPERVFVSGPAAQAARWLHGLIAGEIDADRCDYVMRDAAFYGIPGATFDLDRLLANVSIAKSEAAVINWETVVLPSGVSAAEEFLVARFRLYQWGVYHHKAQQLSAGLRAALIELLRTGAPAARQFLTDYDSLLDEAQPVGRATIEPLVKYDDNWWLGLFKRFIYPDQAAALPEVSENAVADMRSTVYRASGRPSLWKKATDLTQEQLRGLNDAVPRSAEQRPAWDGAVAALSDDEGITVVVFSFRPYRLADEGTRAESRLQVAWTEDGEERLEPLSERSAIVESLYEAWTRSLQVLAFGPRLEGEHTFAMLKSMTLTRLLEAANKAVDEQPKVNESELPKGAS